MGVSDIHIEPYRFSSRVRYRLDGMLSEQEQIRRKSLKKIINYGINPYPAKEFKFSHYSNKPS